MNNTGQIEAALADTVDKLIAKALQLDGSKMVSTALQVLKDAGITPQNINEA